MSVSYIRTCHVKHVWYSHQITTFFYLPNQHNAILAMLLGSYTTPSAAVWEFKQHQY